MISNRGFLYGDGFFETLRVINGQAPLIDFHVNRMLEAMEVYGFHPEFDVNNDFVRSVLSSAPDDGLVRINFFREGEGTYAPSSDRVGFNHTHRPLEAPFFLPIALDLLEELKKAPFLPGTIGVYPEQKPNVPWLNVKSLSSIYYVLAGRYARDHSFDYLLIQDSEGNLCEELASNLLVVRNNEAFLTPADTGAVNGVTQRYIYANYHSWLNEMPLTRSTLDACDAVYLLRGSRGVFRIK